MAHETYTYYRLMKIENGNIIPASDEENEKHETLRQAVNYHGNETSKDKFISKYFRNEEGLSEWKQDYNLFGTKIVERTN